MNKPWTLPTRCHKKIKLSWHTYFIKCRLLIVHIVPMVLSRPIVPAFLLGYLWLHHSNNIIVWPIFFYLESDQKRRKWPEIVECNLLFHRWRKWGLSDSDNTGNWGNINLFLLNHVAICDKIEWNKQLFNT